MNLWLMIAVIVAVGAVGDAYKSKKKNEVKKLELELKIEQEKAKNYERETKLMQAQLDYDRKLLIEQQSTTNREL